MFGSRCFMPQANTRIRKLICVSVGATTVPLVLTGAYYGTKFANNLVKDISFSNWFPKKETAPEPEREPRYNENNIQKPPSRFNLWVNNNWETIRKYGEPPCRIAYAGALGIGSAAFATLSYSFIKYAGTSTRNYLTFVKSSDECCQLIRKTMCFVPKVPIALAASAIMASMCIAGLAVAESTITWEKSNFIKNTIHKFMDGTQKIIDRITNDE